MDSSHKDSSCNVTLNTSDSTSSFAGAFFPRAQQFTVAGGTFTSITKNYHTTTSAPDIDLERETSLVSRRDQRTIRRVYSAKIDGRKSGVTVAMYQGDSAEEEWRRDIDMYMSMRHPNIVQLWGAASSGNIHATIFNDDLIPFRDFLALYRHSHLSTVYIHAYTKMDLKVIFIQYFNAG
ncbi:hypothetical protein B0H12DRAFT_458562 [Mycena haematopus]|nr:hypothetical protein B0H12DRAFT_458562 [Mycena haematopus]